MVEDKGKGHNLTNKYERCPACRGKGWVWAQWPETECCELCSRLGYIKRINEEPMETLEGGGKQNSSPFQSELLPAKALLYVSSILKKGAATHGVNNWHKISVEAHKGRELTHVLQYLENTEGDECLTHLGNAACRALFALDNYFREHLLQRETVENMVGE